ncbi:MAG: lysophospholipid acyltransferase family protein [Nocardioidaceae bacterium]
MAGDDRELAMAFAVNVLRPPLMLLTRREWCGAGHIPATGGCVVVCNHVSDFDPLTAAHFVFDSGRLPRFLGKAEVFGVPVIGRILRAAGQIPVYRESAEAGQALSVALEAVRSGRCVVVYPEGTITRDPDLWPMAGKTGAARIALASGCPLIPVAQWGPQRILAPYTWRLRLFPRKLMQVSAGPPVDLRDLAGQPLTTQLLEQATNRLLDAITALLEDIRGERAPQVRFDPKAAS